jgi:hypothetical protein
MGSVNVSQYVDYEGYAGEYAYATISWDEGPEVTVEITGGNVLTWRIRGRGSDTKEYCVGTGGARSGTFDAEDDKDYVFQIYSQAYSTYSDGEVFTVNFGDDDDDDDDDGGGGSSGGGDYSSTPRTLHINCGVGIEKISLHRSWPEYRPCYDSLDDGAEVYYDGKDMFYISYVRALDGYDVDYYTFNGKQIPCKLQNFAFSKTSGGIDYYKLASDADATISATATVGLTRNLTSSLNLWGKIILVVTMYLGRVGPISLLLAFNTKTGNKNIIKNPTEEISIG